MFHLCASQASPTSGLRQLLAILLLFKEALIYQLNNLKKENILLYIVME